MEWARSAVTEPAEATLERLHVALGAASPGIGEIWRQHRRATARAYEQVIVERGDPSPFRVA